MCLLCWSLLSPRPFKGLLSFDGVNVRVACGVWRLLILGGLMRELWPAEFHEVLLTGLGILEFVGDGLRAERRADHFAR